MRAGSNSSGPLDWAVHIGQAVGPVDGGRRANRKDASAGSIDLVADSRGVGQEAGVEPVIAVRKLLRRSDGERVFSQIGIDREGGGLRLLIDFVDLAA